MEMSSSLVDWRLVRQTLLDTGAEYSLFGIWISDFSGVMFFLFSKITFCMIIMWITWVNSTSQFLTFWWNIALPAPDIGRSTLNDFRHKCVVATVWGVFGTNNAGFSKLWHSPIYSSDYFPFILLWPIYTPLEDPWAEQRLFTHVWLPRGPGVGQWSLVGKPE